MSLIIKRFRNVATHPFLYTSKIGKSYHKKQSHHPPACEWSIGPGCPHNGWSEGPTYSPLRTMDPLRAYRNRVDKIHPNSLQAGRMDPCAYGTRHRARSCLGWMDSVPFRVLLVSVASCWWRMGWTSTFACTILELPRTQPQMVMSWNGDKPTGETVPFGVDNLSILSWTPQFICQYVMGSHMTFLSRFLSSWRKQRFLMSLCNQSHPMAVVICKNCQHCVRWI